MYICWHIHCPAQKKQTNKKKLKTPHTYNWMVSSFSMHCGITLTSLYNVTTFVSVQRCINFPQRSLLMMGESGHCVKSSPSHRFSMGLRSGVPGRWFMCENFASCSLNHSFAIWARWNMALSSLICPCHQGKTIIWWTTWSFSTFRPSTVLIFWVKSEMCNRHKGKAEGAVKVALINSNWNQ